MKKRTIEFWQSKLDKALDQHQYIRLKLLSRFKPHAPKKFYRIGYKECPGGLEYKCRYGKYTKEAINTPKTIRKIFLFNYRWCGQFERNVESFRSKQTIRAELNKRLVKLNNRIKYIKDMLTHV
jgi:hypothetical protein